MVAARVLGAALLVSAVVFVPASGEPNTCEACHSDASLLVKNRRLYDYYQDWLTSPHREASVTCDRCHGGHPASADKAAAHAGRLPVLDPASSVFFRRQPETCGACHAEVARQFTQSRHCSKVLREDTAPSCSTCHRAMNRKPYYRDILREGCRHCHNTEPRGLRPEVVDQADEVLHRLNIARGFLGWTTIHLEREGWPGDSRARLDALRQAYHASLARVHSLELMAADASSVELLSELKQIFREHRAPQPDSSERGR
jgi:hypothetical protein